MSVHSLVCAVCVYAYIFCILLFIPVSQVYRISLKLGSALPGLHELISTPVHSSQFSSLIVVRHSHSSASNSQLSPDEILSNISAHTGFSTVKEVIRLENVEGSHIDTTH